MATQSTFHKWIMPYAQGAPPITVNNALMDALREFCARTQWWREDVAAVALVKDQTLYAFAPPTDAELIIPTRVAVGNGTTELRELGESTTREEMDRDRKSWQIAASRRDPIEWWIPDTGSIEVWPAPDAVAVTDALKFYTRWVLSPALAATTIDDRFLYEARMAIIAGALKELLMQKAPWQDKKEARDREQEFNSYIAEFTFKAQTGGGNRVLSARTSGSGIV